VSDSGDIAAFYRLAAGLIAEVRVAADNFALLQQIS
jgi:hypothetical protein